MTTLLTSVRHPVQVDDKGLGAIVAWLGHPSIVGLGESVHGTDTLHRLAHQIFVQLSEHEHFTVFAWEIDQAHGHLLDQYVQGQRDDLASLMASRFWGQKMFYDKALVDVLEWMRAHNADSDSKVHFAGFDVKKPRLCVDLIVACLRGIDADTARRVEANYDAALAIGDFGSFPNVYGFTTDTTLNLPASPHPRDLHVRLRIHTSGVRWGRVGISGRETLSGSQFLALATPEQLQAGVGTLEARIRVPPNASRVTTSLFHRGDGVVEFEPPVYMLDGTRIHATPSFRDMRPHPLLMPRFQSMDYQHEFVLNPNGEISRLRVTADPRLDRSLSAVWSAEEETRRAVAGSDRIRGTKRVWIEHLARLVTQAVEWRTLLQPNRDVFLAENLEWLQKSAYPKSRILALAHSSHTENRPTKMGGFLTAELEDRYRTISMLAGSGHYRYFGGAAELKPNAPLQDFPVKSRQPPLSRSLCKRFPGDFAVHVNTPGGDTPELKVLYPDAGSRPDVLIWIGEVRPIELAGDPTEAPPDQAQPR